MLYPGSVVPLAMFLLDLGGQYYCIVYYSGDPVIFCGYYCTVYTKHGSLDIWVTNEDTALREYS